VLRRIELSRPSVAATSRAKLRLERLLGPSKVVTDPDMLVAYAGDESDNEPILPDLAVLAASADDVAAVMRVAEDEAIPVTPRGGGSGKSGGCIPVAGGIVLATGALSSIVDIDRGEHLVVVEPGVVLADLHAAVEAEGLFYGPDPSSLGWCQLGGTIAENAAGPRALGYGATRDWVLGLEIVPVGGERSFVGRRTRKGVTGYDLVSLLVGSEGTLALSTRAVLRLVPKPEAVRTVLALFDDAYAAGRAVAAVFAAGILPRCAELLDRRTLELVRARDASIDRRGHAMLVVELDGDELACERAMERAGAACDGAGAITVLVAQDAARRDALWSARRALSTTTRAIAKFKVSEDVVVPRRHIPTLLEELERMREGEARASEERGDGPEARIELLAYGHAGDGNLHVNFLWNQAEAAPRVEQLLGQLFRKVVELGGTLTGEHGVGLSKAPYLRLEQSDATISLQQRIKAVFDPKGLLNPGKIFAPRGHGLC